MTIPRQQEWKDLGPADLESGQHRGVQVGDEEYVVVANLEGTYHAIDDLCNHAGCLLSRGPFEEDLIVCPCHHAEFSIRTGELVSLPRICDDQVRYDVKVVDARILGRRVEDR